MQIRLYSIYFYVLSLYLSTLFVTLFISFHVFIDGLSSSLHNIPLCEYIAIYLSILLLIGHWFVAFSIASSAAVNIIVPLLMNAFPVKGLLKKEIASHRVNFILFL